MALTKPKAFWPLLITAAVNDKLDFNRGGVKVATIAPGTYYSAKGLANAVQAAFTAADGGAVWTCAVSSQGIITISANLAFTLLFLTGVNAGQGTFLLLGYTGTDKGSAVSQVAEAQHQNGWYADDAAEDDTPDLARVIVTKTRSLDGHGREVRFGVAHYDRSIHLSFLAAARTFIEEETAPTLNQAIERLILNGSAGFRWWKDQTDMASGLVLPLGNSGTVATYRDYSLTQKTAEAMQRLRLAPAVPLYSLVLDCERYLL